MQRCDGCREVCRFTLEFEPSVPAGRPPAPSITTVARRIARACNAARPTEAFARDGLLVFELSGELRRWQAQDTFDLGAEVILMPLHAGRTTAASVQARLDACG